LWLLDNSDLKPCAATAAEPAQRDLHVAVARIRLAGTSGSAVYPIAAC
jgi:hypothetical protein